LRFPTRENILGLNRRHLGSTGGEFFEPENLLNQGSLEWVLEAIRYPLFGVIRYPSLAEKAAWLAWIIIRGHVFWDGNKRTGMSALEAMLRLNDYWLDAMDDEIEEVALRIAGSEGDYSYEEFVEWVRSKIVLKAI